ncbi:efflux RND transporter periplasmic adaptor subunit [Pedobacter psychroterrae]|uniref:Efflux RND transporter periplasmic adaptor subunit n=1 Tax=Pedobacter psychroterrae TaxID=2530453 RepID=A0A4R0NUH6_9SPHI|nr:efflux RND transporter periplasmic adaptor subunit [Pedobacter psychroterrae]TCD03849.1 efflux RND transporter periplasmic adaptor subunit [Pedobacter psychroterrae]
MERKLFIKKMALLALVPSVFIAACSSEQQSNGEAAKGKQQTFTCPMHPQVIKNEMGTCPICGMDLVPFEKNSNEKALKIDEKRQVLANITTILIGESSLSSAKQLNGRLVVNPEKSSYISSRIAGRIEQLYIRETGVKVGKGQALYKLYSEQLATLQQEYLMAIAQEKQFQGDKIERQLVAAAKQKLLLYGQSENQVQQLVKAQKKDPYVVFYAPEGGVVAELSVTQGQYVTEGSPILRLEGYDRLWVEADVYPNEVKNIELGQKVKVVIAGWEDQPQEVGIDFITPSFQSGTQLTQIRGSIPNPGGQWQPGLQANVFLPSASNNNVLTLPVDAVIRDGKGMHVWIKKGKDSFEPRLVKTGEENDSKVGITAGLVNGDQVVVTGAYLLYSEYILKKGKNPNEELKINNQ